MCVATEREMECNNEPEAAGRGLVSVHALYMMATLCLRAELVPPVSLWADIFVAFL